MRRFLVAVALVASWVVSSPAIADEPAETASAATAELAIHRFLDARHALPSRETLDAALPDAEQQLIAVAVDASASAWSRQRAISSLSMYRTDAAMVALGSLTYSDDADVRAMALYTLARTFPAVGPELLVLRLETTARVDGSERVVEYAIRSLRWIDSPSADAALARLAADGPNPRLASSTRTARAERLGQSSTAPLPSTVSP